MKFLRNSRGDTELFVVVVIIIGAFLLIGGQFLLPHKKPNSANGGNAENGGGGSFQWSIEQVVAKAGCQSGKSQVEIAFHGNQPGFYKVEVKNGEVFSPVLINGETFNAFTPNTQNIQVNDLSLSNSDGFNTKDWQVTLYQGGTVAGTSLSDGVEKAKQGFQKTSCP